MTQREMGALLGVPTPTIGRWEAGMRDPGAIGEALARLILDAPERAAQVLSRVATAPSERRGKIQPPSSGRRAPPEGRGAGRPAKVPAPRGR